MKKELILSFTILGIIIIFIVWLVYWIINPKSGGRDTNLSLGDGTFQILRGSDMSGNKIYNLTNVVESNTVVNLVVKYMLDEENYTIYVVGKNQPNDVDYQYLVLNYKTGKYNIYFDFNELPANKKIIFEKQNQFIIP